MRARRLDPGELDRFLVEYERASGHHPPREYLQRVEVFGVCHAGALIGGYAVNRSRPWSRSIECLPAADRAVWEAMLPARPIEIACAWLANEARKGWRSYAFWCQVLIAARRGSDVLVGTNVTKLADAYRAILRPVREYHGPYEIDGHPTAGWIMLAPRPGLRTIGSMAIYKLRTRKAREQR